MLFRSLVAASALLVASSALAQEAPPQSGDHAALGAAAGRFVVPTNAERTRVVVDLLTQAGLKADIQTFQGGNDRTGPMEGANVVTTVGEGPADIVLTAHYDAVKLPDGSLSQGVVDNAGSVLALIEAAATLKEGLEGQPAAYRFVFVFTDQEELGLIGAKNFLETHGKDRIAAVINADVAAYGETVMYGENNGDQSAFVLAALRGLCAERAFDCLAFPNYPPSDDRVFSAAGVPVVSLGTQDAVGAHQMWLAFNGGRDNGLKAGFVPPVFQRIHSTEDRLAYFNGDDVARFGLFVADLALKLSTQLDEYRPEPDEAAPEPPAAPDATPGTQ